MMKDYMLKLKFSREQYVKEEATSYFKVSFEILKNAWRKFVIAMRTVKSEDFGEASECNTSSFLLLTASICGCKGIGSYYI